MDGTRGTLVVCCQYRALRTLLRGVAGDLDMGFRPVQGIDEVRSLLGTVSPPALLVMGVSAACREHLSLLREAQGEFGVQTVLVVENMDESIRNDATRSGATACLDLEEAMESLIFLLENIVTGMLPRDDTVSRAGIKRVLTLADQVTLSVPGYWVRDGQRETRLPPILGSLLGCLASHPNDLVSFSHLLQAGWGCENGATINALHQQIHQLRERLLEHGISEHVQSVRGQGYMLRTFESLLGGLSTDHPGTKTDL